MKVTTIKAALGTKVPTQPYGSVDVFLEYTAEVDPAEDVSEATRSLYQLAQEEIAERLIPIVKKKMSHNAAVISNWPKKEQEAFWAQFASMDALRILMPEGMIDDATMQRLVDDVKEKGT